MWQPDGWGQTRIGVLTPHADIVPETEFSALAPAGVSIHATRVPFGAYKPSFAPSLCEARIAGGKSSGGTALGEGGLGVIQPEPIAL